MFASDFRENRDGIVDLPNKHYDDMVELLNVVYPNKMRDLPGIWSK
jgi:hypothetical protein